MMSMTFGVSSSVTLLFDFWQVRGVAGMVLSVFVVLLLTVFYEVLKVWRLWLDRSSRLAPPPPVPPDSLSCGGGGGGGGSNGGDGGSSLQSGPSESSLTPMTSQTPPTNTRNRLLLHAVQTLLHVLQVSLGYVLMLCVMSYNTWIFLGVVGGSVLGYFISFPLTAQN